MNPNFQYAHIVPVSQLPDIAGYGYQMCLAHLVHTNEEYRGFYKRCIANGEFVIMDNGAAEGAQPCLDTLVNLWCEFVPSEVILPDILFDGMGTVASTSRALDRLDACGVRFLPRLMAVPQGKSMHEWKRCAYSFLTDTRIKTIGVSKFITSGNHYWHDLHARLHAVAWLDEMVVELGRHDVQVHLLGLDEGPGIVGEIIRQFGIVRGCDSAFAYLAAQSGKDINFRTIRPEGEIDFVHGRKQPNFVHNANLLYHATAKLAPDGAM